ncbi:hypothetical protein E1301_Tti019186 [Triplophysa tibetana]|uniref:Uncharacterized protein n=1 Tax=Triplophysa tibetana TaxID=1572043 RepID=A0A5A9P234_9TELE|nr:hypothetical protein E1301_Tti019186 [Triplophysa tibetana]
MGSGWPEGGRVTAGDDRLEKLCLLIYSRQYHRTGDFLVSGELQASEISRDVCFPATQDPFDIGSGSCTPTGGTPEAEIEGETSTPSATFSREGTLTGRPQGEQHRARTFTATALIGRYGTAPASSPKPDPFQGLAPTYSQSFSVLPGCTCSRSHTPLDCARQTRPHALARRRVVYTRQLLPLSNRQCVQLSR